MLETTRKSWMWENHRLLTMQRVLIGRVLGRKAIRFSNRGLRLELPPRLHIRCYAWTGELSANVSALVSVLARQGGTFLDIGAFVGQHCQRAVVASSGACNVVAFEPDPRARTVLLQQLAGAKILGNVEVRTEAVSDHDGEAQFLIAEVPSLSGLEAHVPGQYVSLPTVDFASLICDLKPSFVKMDVEGSEARLISHLGTIPRDAIPVIIAENNSGASAAAKELGLLALNTLEIFPRFSHLSNLSNDLLIVPPSTIEVDDVVSQANDEILRILSVPVIRYFGRPFV